VRQGSSGVDAIPVFVRSDQVNAIMPANAPIGKAVITVSFGGTASNPAPVVIASHSVGLFSVGGTGRGPAAIQNFRSSADQPTNSMRSTATPGQTVILWATGLGPALNVDNVAPLAGDLPVGLEIFVGGRSARRLYAGRSTCCSGLDQIVFQVPSDVPAGCWVPVQVRTEDGNVSNAVTMAISAQGIACSDASNPFSPSLIKGGNVGVAVLERHDVIEDIDFNPARTSTDDFATVSVRSEGGGEHAFNPLFSLPPVGTCTFYAAREQILQADPRALVTALSLSGNPLASRPAITVSNSTRTVSVGAGSNDWSIYTGWLGSSDDTNPPLFLNDPGGFTITNAGAGLAAPFNAAVPPLLSITWTGRSTTRQIDRSQNLVLNWSADSGGLALILGGNYDQPANASGVFLCTALSEAGSLAVPSYVLAGVPKSRAVAGQSAGYVLLGIVARTLAPLDAPGLDAGFAFPLYWSEKSVVFQ
jgi:uncharacterized protein (TIGR03437 family)